MPELFNIMIEIMEKREYEGCWFSSSDDFVHDCGNWDNCDPNCPLRQLMDLVGIKPQPDGGVDKQVNP